MLEREIERHLTKRCKEYGILCYKFTSPQHKNVPDRILVYNTHVVFLELKATGKKPTEGQMREIDRINGQGGLALWANSTTAIDNLIMSLLYQRVKP